MCGLIGEVRWHQPAWPQPLEPLRHRGPDAEGTWHSPEGHCWLGHTRLAILDLTEAGAQPITSHCGRLTLVFNGEIYNYIELRDELQDILQPDCVTHLLEQVRAPAQQDGPLLHHARLEANEPHHGAHNILHELNGQDSPLAPRRAMGNRHHR